MAVKYTQIKAWATLFALIAAPIASIAVPVVLAIVGFRVQTSLNSRQMGAEYVKQATNILSQQSQSQPLRRWATDVFSRYSPVPVSKTVLDALKSGQLNLPLPAVNACPPQGDAIPSWIKQLNALKNRTATPEATDFNHKITLEAILVHKNDEQRWKNSDAATITGYVVGVHPGGIETANCHATTIDSRDTLIEIAPTPQAPATEQMIVEVTPWWRSQMATQNVDWRTPTLKKSLRGKRVTITGWMLFDAEHKGQAENTNLDGKGNWRATAWEIHPVAAITVAAAGSP